jgi:SAM-dependent methyltransferase
VDDAQSTTIGLWSGVASHYDIYRPKTPPVLLDLLPQLAETEHPRLVVDLGCGTGLSTYVWAERAERVLGIEPNADMRRQAEAKGAGQGALAHVRFQDGVSHATGLPDGCADIVTCAQSLHWMDPKPTFAEVARLLRPGGIFAAYDYDWPPVITPEAILLFHTFMGAVTQLETVRGIDIGMWTGLPKQAHLQRMEASGQFRLTRELSVHSREQGDAERFVGLALSVSAAILLARGLVTEEELGLAALRSRAEDMMGASPRPWYFSYHVRIGLK